MGMNNIQLYNLAKSYLGDGGSRFRQFCGLPSSAAWCAAFVSYIFAKGGDASLFYGGRKVVYVPSAQTWCRANLAEIPIYMAMPMDIITFDWNKNAVPDHIGFVRARKSDMEIYTIEGNTSGGIVAERTRPYKYISGVWRPQFRPTSFTTLKKLVIDGQFDYNSIACLQLALRRGGYYKGEIDAILGKETVKALQKKVGVAQDGAWGIKTTKAVQKWLNIKVDGWWGVSSTKSLQRWINQYNDWYAHKHNIKPQTDPTPSPKPTPKPKTIWDKANTWAKALCKSVDGIYRVFTDDPRTQICPICHKDAKHGMNCINAAFAYWRHGAGIPCRCNAEVINDDMGDRILRSNAQTALELVKRCTGLTAVKVISNSGKAIPTSKLQEGDIIMYFDGDDFSHMAVCVGNGKMFDCARGHVPEMQFGLPIDWWTKENGWSVKIAIRYNGKVVL